MKIGNHYDVGLGSVPLAKFNPAVKFFTLFLVSFALMFVLDPVTPLVFYVFCLFLVKISVRVSWGFIFKRQLPFVGFALGFLLINAFTRSGEVLWQSGWLQITLEGLLVGTSLFWRTLVIAMLVVAFLVTTDPVVLLESLSQQARLPAKFSYALLSGYQMLQNMPVQWQIINMAHKVRLGSVVKFSFWFRMKIFCHACFVLLLTSLRQAEVLSQALESRGLGLVPRTVWRPVVLGWRDCWVFVVVFGFFGVSVWVSYLLGFLAGPALLF